MSYSVTANLIFGVSIDFPEEGGSDWEEKVSFFNSDNPKAPLELIYGGCCCSGLHTIFIGVNRLRVDGTGDVEERTMGAMKIEEVEFEALQKFCEIHKLTYNPKWWLSTLGG